MGRWLSPFTRINILRILPFGLIWLFFSLVYSLVEKGLMGDLDKYPATGNAYHFSKSVWITGTTAGVLGLLMGTVEILFFNKLFPKLSLFRKIVYKLLIYILIIIFFLLAVTTLYNANELQTHLLDKRVFKNLWIFFFSFSTPLV